MAEVIGAETRRFKDWPKLSEVFIEWLERNPAYIKPKSNWARINAAFFKEYKENSYKTADHHDKPFKSVFGYKELRNQNLTEKDVQLFVEATYRTYKALFYRVYQEYFAPQAESLRASDLSKKDFVKAINDWYVKFKASYDLIDLMKSEYYEKLSSRIMLKVSSGQIPSEFARIESLTIDETWHEAWFIFIKKLVYDERHGKKPTGHQLWKKFEELMDNFLEWLPHAQPTHTVPSYGELTELFLDYLVEHDSSIAGRTTVFCEALIALEPKALQESARMRKDELRTEVTRLMAEFIAGTKAVVEEEMKKYVGEEKPKKQETEWQFLLRKIKEFWVRWKPKLIRLGDFFNPNLIAKIREWLKKRRERIISGTSSINFIDWREKTIIDIFEQSIVEIAKEYNITVNVTINKEGDITIVNQGGGDGDRRPEPDQPDTPDTPEPDEAQFGNLWREIRLGNVFIYVWLRTDEDEARDLKNSRQTNVKKYINGGQFLGSIGIAPKDKNINFIDGYMGRHIPGILKGSMIKPGDFVCFGAARITPEIISKLREWARVGWINLGWLARAIAYKGIFQINEKIMRDIDYDKLDTWVWDYWAVPAPGETGAGLHSVSPYLLLLPAIGAANHKHPLSGPFGITSDALEERFRVQSASKGVVFRFKLNLEHDFEFDKEHAPGFICAELLEKKGTNWEHQVKLAKKFRFVEVSKGGTTRGKENLPITDFGLKKENTLEVEFDAPAVRQETTYRMRVFVKKADMDIDQQLTKAIEAANVNPNNPKLWDYNYIDFKVVTEKATYTLEEHLPKEEENTLSELEHVKKIINEKIIPHLQKEAEPLVWNEPHRTKDLKLLRKILLEEEEAEKRLNSEDMRMTSFFKDVTQDIGALKEVLGVILGCYAKKGITRAQVEGELGGLSQDLVKKYPKMGSITVDFIIDILEKIVNTIDNEITVART
ncbi:MAG: hypothetical protein ABIE94_00910 [archaeon]